MKLLSVIGTLLFWSLNAWAQQGTPSPQIGGRVLTGANTAADGATVTLVMAQDSAIIKSTFTDAKGQFLFEGLKADRYRVWVTLVGYAKYRSEVLTILAGEAVKIWLPAITLHAGSTQLKEVAITGQKSFVEQKIDRVVVNPDALISNAGSTVLDVLAKSPGVQVGDNGAISFKGKSGVVIFVDDKPTYLSGADLESYLRSLPSSTIDQIELMANPPAKYDAAGSAGVINIRTKRSKLRGFNGSVALSYTQGKYGKTNNNANFNYRNNKLNYFANLSYSYTNNFTDLDINRRFKNTDNSTRSYFLQNTFIRTYGNGVLGKAGADYYASDKTTFGVVFTGLLRPGNRDNANTSRILNPGQQLDSSIVADNTQRNKFTNGGINLNYRHQYDKNGRELTVDADYIAYHTNSNQSFNNFTYLPNQTLTATDFLTGRLPAYIDIYAVKADYTHPLQNGVRLAAGAKSSYTTTDNTADYAYTVRGIITPDYDKSNHFLYKENINAAYVNASKDFKRLSVQAGLRLENTLSDGHQLGNIQKPDSAFKRRYTSLFPTVYLSYKTDSAGNNQFGLNYGRRINRPYYQDLNPFLSPLDKFTFYVGNPFLKPSYANNFALSHTYKNRITTTLSYSHIADNVTETIEIVNGIYYSRRGNIGKTDVLSISVDGGWDFGKWLTTHLYTEVTQIHSQSAFYTGLLNTKGTFVYVQPNLQFKLSPTWTAQVDGLFQSRVTTAQFITGNTGRVNAGVSKKLSAVTTVRFSVNDIFYTGVNKGIINNLAGADATFTNWSDTRTAVLTLSYRFGKSVSGTKKHEGNSAGSEQDRVRG